MFDGSRARQWVQLLRAHGQQAAIVLVTIIICVVLLIPALGSEDAHGPGTVDESRRSVGPDRGAAAAGGAIKRQEPQAAAPSRAVVDQHFADRQRARVDNLDRRAREGLWSGCCATHWP
jgi:hypothetical protein